MVFVAVSFLVIGKVHLDVKIVISRMMCYMLYVYM